MAVAPATANSQFYTLTPPMESEPTSMVTSTPATPPVFELTEAVRMKPIPFAFTF